MKMNTSGRFISVTLKMKKIKKSNQKKDFILVLLSTKQKNQIRELSEKESRSLSNFCLNAIQQYISKQEEKEKNGNTIPKKV